MKTDDLISQLTSDLKPVKPWASPWKMTLQYSLLGLVIVAGLLTVIGYRIDIHSQWAQGHFWLGLILWAIFFVTCIHLVFTLAMPGQKLSKFLQGLAAFIGLGVLGWHFQNILGLSSEGWEQGAQVHGVSCAVITLIAALASGFLVTRQIRKGGSPRPLLSSLGVAAGSLAAGGLLISFVCGDGNGAHILFWHFLIPAIMVFATALFLIKKLLRW